jgi:hypothetical protein
MDQWSDEQQQWPTDWAWYRESQPRQETYPETADKEYPIAAGVRPARHQ